jgi:hypothetical protein
VNSSFDEHQYRINSERIEHLFNQIKSLAVGDQRIRLVDTTRVNFEGMDLKSGHKITLAQVLVPIANISLLQDDISDAFIADIEFLHEEICNFLIAHRYIIRKAQLTRDYDSDGNIEQDEYSLHYYLSDLKKVDKLIEIEDELELDLSFHNPSTSFYNFIDDKLTVFLHLVK